MAVSLREVEVLIDSLAATAQVLLLQYLIPRLAETMRTMEPDRAGTENAWQEFRRVGERLAATSNGQSITQTITDMRR